MKDGAEFSSAREAAEKRARAAGRPVHSLDVLSALCAFENPARALLAERGAAPEAVEAIAGKGAKEGPGLAAQLADRAREIARGCGGTEVVGLHLLIALCRVPCAAHDALAGLGVDLGALGTQALAYCVSGRMPRRLQPGRAATSNEEEEQTPPGRPRGPAPSPPGGLHRGAGKPAPAGTSNESPARPGSAGGAPDRGPSPVGSLLPRAARPGRPRSQGDEAGDEPAPPGSLYPRAGKGPAAKRPSGLAARLGKAGEDKGHAPAPPGPGRPAGGNDAPAQPGSPRPAGMSSDAARGAAPGGSLPATRQPGLPAEGAAPPPTPGEKGTGAAPPASSGEQPAGRGPSELPLPGGAPDRKPGPPKSWAPRRKPPPPGAPLDEKHFPTLHELGRNLSELARLGKLDPVVGREKEIEQVIDILGKRRTNNPCLVGEAGVGKTAVVEGVAQKLRGLKGHLGQCAIFELDVGSLVAGTELRGSLSERLNALKDEVRAAEGRVIVFIDEVHTLVGAGATGDGAQDAANELKTALARGEFPCIGATTHGEFQAHVLADPALERRFTRVSVPEPTVPQALAILKGLVTRYEAHHKLRFAHAAVEAIPALAARYIPDRQLPDKAISVLDLAGSRAHREGKTFVQLPDVQRVVAQLAGVPEDRLLADESKRLLGLEEALGARVVGHAETVRAVAQVLRRNYAGFSSQRPMGSFLLLGPTGVGKTELARALADVLFGSRDALVRVDMSELSEAHAVSRLVGAPAGYVGHSDGGQLTEAVRRRPSSVVLLDEIEKAHRGAWMLMLQVLEEGQLTDGRGRHVNFSNSVVLLTSNLGAEAFGRKGGGRAEAFALAQRALPPELWNRLDERLVMGPLARADVARVARLLVAESAARLAGERSIQYEVDDAVVEHLLDNGGYDAALGARPMRQAVQRLLEAPLSDRVLAGGLKAGDRVRVSVRGGTLRFDKQ